VTYYHTYQDCKACESDREFAKCKSKHPKPKKILLECGEGTGSRTFNSFNDTSFQIANVIIDTTCLDRSEVLIKFSSLVRFTNLAVMPNTATIRLKYELFRACDDVAPISLGTWMFEEVNVLETSFNAIEQSFNFIFCDSSNCLGCCSYFVRVTPIEITNATAIVSNGRIAALTQDLRHNLKDNCKTFNPIHRKGVMPMDHKSKDIILACRQGNGAVVFKRTGLQNLVDIARVVIDATCLNKPKILIEFSSIINLSVGIDDAILRFELFRVCGDSEPVSRGTWIFEMTNTDGLISKSFSFIFCECETLSKYYEYFFKVAPIRIDEDIDESVIVSNVWMAALAQSSKETLNYDDYKTSNEQSNYNNCRSLGTKPKEILLECGSGTGSSTFTSSSEVPFQLAHVTIDTTEFCRPIVNIQFSSIVSYQVLVNNSSLHLRYELFRTCDNKIPISLGLWEFQINNSQDEPKKATESFDFMFCDCITCPDCFDYLVMVTPVEIIEISGISAVATVSNGRIAALAGEI